MNTRFGQLAACLDISAGGKTDKESILAEAVEHVKKQAAKILTLEKQNRDLLAESKSLREEKNELRQDKNYIREERDKYKVELDSLRADRHARKRLKLDNSHAHAEHDTLVRIKDERLNGVNKEVKT